jgi:magnesium-transporting ATPase (P-type)
VPAARPGAKAASQKPAADDLGSYGFREDPTEKDEVSVKERAKAMGPLEDRRPRSSRGPAMAMVTKPSNQMLMAAVVSCVCCILTVVVLLWPIVFPPKERAEDPDMVAPKNPALVEKAKQDRAELVFTNFLLLGLTVIAFVYNGFVATGAVKMQALESYPLSLTAAVTIALPFNWILAYGTFYWFIAFLNSVAPLEFASMLVFATLFAVGTWYTAIGVWNVMTLRKPDVIAGFKEKKPTD